MTSTGKKIDINVADVDTLASLTGVGRSRAEAIMEVRKSLGGFTSIEDLKLVPGIGMSLIDANRPHMYLTLPGHSGKRGRRAVRCKVLDDSITTNPTPDTSTNISDIQIDGSDTHTDVGEDNSEKDCKHCDNKSDTSSTKDVRSPCRDSGMEPSSVEEQNDSCTAEKGDCSDSNKQILTVQEDKENDGAVVDNSSTGSDGVGREGSEPLVDEEMNSEESEDEVEEQDSDLEWEYEDDDCIGVEFKFADEYLRQDKEASNSSVDKNAMMKRKPSSPCETPYFPSVPTKKKVCRQKDNDSDGEGGESETDESMVDARSDLTPCGSPVRPDPSPDISNWLTTFKAWGHTERLAALDHLIDTCDPVQVRHMLEVIEPRFQRDFISLLPKELALYVLSFLEPKDLLRAAQTCQYWRILAEDNLLWREKCREDNIDEALVFEKHRKRCTNFVTSPYKTAYMRFHNIEMNWRYRPIRPPKLLKGHDDHVITCLQFSGHRIVSGSDDNTLKVWNAITGKCLKTLVGHTGGVWSSQMADKIIVSGSTDRTLKVWDADEGRCIHTLYGHTSTVRCMSLHKKIVVSGSRDATLRVWDVETGECLHVLVGHVAAVRCVQYDGKLVVSGAYDYMVRVWNPEQEECLYMLQGHTNRVYSLQFDGVHVVSGSLDTSIRVWDVESGSCKHTLMGHQSLTSGMELRDNILVSGNADSTVKIWDINTGQCLQTLAGQKNKHQSAVTCLQFTKQFVVTSSDDGTVKLWDWKTGEFIRDLVALPSGGSGGVVWRIRASETKLVCAVGSRNGTEETKLLVLDFDVEK